MRRLEFSMALAVIAAGCNGLLGLDPGKPRSNKTGGESGAGEGGEPPTGGTAGSAVGGSSSTMGGTQGDSGEAGTAGGGTGGNGGSSGRGGNSGNGGSGDTGGSSGAGGDGACSPKACREDGLGNFCVNGECVDVTTAECPDILGDDWVNDDPEAEPYFIGAVTRRSSRQGSDIGSFFYRNLALAMREFSAHGRIRIEGKEQRPVLVLCSPLYPENIGSSNVDPLEGLRVSIDHLVDDLRVPGALLLLSRSEVDSLVRETLGPARRDLFFLDVGGATPGLLDLPDIAGYEEGMPLRNGRLWHMLGDAKSLSYSYASLVELIEERINPGASAGTSAEPTRIAIVQGQDEYSRWIAGTLADLSFGSTNSPLRLNGKYAWEFDQPGAVEVFYDFSSPEELVASIAAFEPHIVLDFNNYPTLPNEVDEALRDRGSTPPFYVFPPERAGARFELFPDPFEVDSTLRMRVLGLNFASAEDPTLYEGYLARLQAMSPGFQNPPNFENAYDAVYYLVYASAAGGPGGTAKAIGFQRLLFGPQRDIGPEGIRSVLARLESSPDATLNLRGPSGDYPFNAPTGGRVAFANAWCIDEELNTVRDTLRYDQTTGIFSGTLPCFPWTDERR